MPIITNTVAVTVLIIVICISVFAQHQNEIPWLTLSDSPWPMMKHDPQATGRSPFVGPKTANIIWTMDMPYGLLSGPSIGPDNNLYFGSNTFFFNDTANYFYSIYPKGEIRWEIRTPERYANPTAALISADSSVYLNSTGYNLYSVKLNGEFNWTYTAETRMGLNTLNIDLNNNIYFVTQNGELNSINSEGVLNWSKSYDTGFWTNLPVLSPDGQTIYIAGKDSNLYAINLDGSLKWKLSSGPASGAPAVDNDGNIYIVAGLDSMGMQSIKPDGSIRWSYNYYENVRDEYSSPTIDKNGNIVFYINQTWPYLYKRIISVDHFGNYNWEYVFKDEEEWILQPLICDDDGTIYCGSTLGKNFYAISNEGKLLWKFPLNDYQVDYPPAIGTDGTLYIGTHLGAQSTGQEKTLIAVRDSGTTSVNDDLLIEDYYLNQNYPNPFNPTTTIDYSIKLDRLVSLKVYDILGSEVVSLVNENQVAGNYSVQFDASSAAGGLPSGIYIYRLTSGQFTSSRKLILLK